MKIYEKLILWILLITGYGLMFFLTIWSIWEGFIVGQAEKVKFNFIIGAILLVSGFIFSGWIMKLYERKLQAIATVEEMGQTPATNLITTRILKMTEVLLPLTALAFLIKGLTDINISIPPNIVITNIICWVVIGFGVLLVHDFLKKIFISKKNLRQTVKLNKQVDKYNQKQIKIQQKRK